MELRRQLLLQADLAIIMSEHNSIDHSLWFYYLPAILDIRIHFADTVNSLEQLSRDAESMFKRAEETLAQADKMDDDEQGYCKQF